MARGVIPMALSMFKEMLILPEDYALISAYYEHQTESVCLVVEHPDIPEREERLTKAIPVYIQHVNENGIRTTSLKDIHFCL